MNGILFNIRMIIDLANILYGYTTVPIAETSETTAVEAMLKQTNINALFISLVASKSLLNLNDRGNLSTLILLENFPE